MSYGTLFKGTTNEVNIMFRICNVCNYLLKRFSITLLLLTVWSTQTIAFEVEIRTLESFGFYNGLEFERGADIAVDSQGRPVVVYINPHTPPDSLMMSRCLDSMCDNVSTTTLASDVGNLQNHIIVSIAFKEDDTLGIAFSRQEDVNGSLEKRLYYIECTDPSCESKKEFFAWDGPMFTEIGFDNNGILNLLVNSENGFFGLAKCDIENGDFTNECVFPWSQWDTYPLHFELLFNSDNFPVIAWQQTRSPYPFVLLQEGYVVQCLDIDCFDQSVSSDLSGYDPESMGDFLSAPATLHDFAITKDDVVVSSQQILDGDGVGHPGFSNCVDNSCTAPMINSLVPNVSGSHYATNVDALPSGSFIVSYTERRNDAPASSGMTVNEHLYAATCYFDSTCEAPVLIEADLGWYRHYGNFHSVATDTGVVYLTYFDTIVNGEGDGEKELKIARLGNDTCTISAPTNDSWIRSNRASNNYGGQTKLDVRPKNSSGKNIRRSLVHFDLNNSDCLETGLPLPIESVAISAELQFTIKREPSTQRQLAVTRILQSWSEESVTWNNQPIKEVTSTDISNTGTVGSTMSWDVSADVSQFVDGSLANYGWILTDIDEDISTSGSGAITRLTSKEDSSMQQPTLVIKYSK